MRAITWPVLSYPFSARVATALALILTYAHTNPFVSQATQKTVPVKTITCIWPPNSEIGLNTLEEDNRVRLALYEAVGSRVGVVKAKVICATIEGDPVPTYATAKGGKIRVTYDRSKDRYFKFHWYEKLFGGNSFTTRKVEIGYLERGNFVPLSESVPHGQRLILRLRKREYF
jgi:hypothetical protein